MLTITENIPSKLELIPKVILKIIDGIKPAIEERELFNIKLSLEEALVNAIKHGNKLNPDLTVTVVAELNRDILRIKIQDQGKGFDFLKVPNPTANDNLHKTSGRGIFLIKNLMDRVEFFDCGRGIEMIKFLRQGGKL